MGVNDGMVLGSAKILDNGPDNQRMNIVLLAEGFQAGQQQDDFDALCDEFVAALQAEPWYPAVGGAINVFKLNVTSTDSGADDPADCPDESEPADGTEADTYFDATFCTSNIHRCLAPNWSLVTSTLNTHVPQWYAGAVIVNTPKRGGCASSGNRIFATGLGTSVGETWTDIALHEFGHAAFSLADEYPYGYGNNAPSGEPPQPNVTTATSLADLAATGQPIKQLWVEMVTPEVPIPTMENPDCTMEDERPNVLSSDFQIGLFEGAKYYHCGRYRPAYLCRMRVAKEPFCGVCIQGIADQLNNYIAATPRMEVVTGNGSLVLDFGQVAHGLTMYRSFEVRNRQIGFPGTLRVNLSPPSGQFSYAPNTDLSFTLPAPVNEPYTTRKVFVAFTSSNVGGPNFSGSLQVTTPDDPLTPLVTVDLLALAIPPPPVDSVLVFDRSGSMSEATGIPGKQKVDLAIEAGQLYISLLKDNDRIGLVRFNNAAQDPQDILLSMELVGGPGNGRADALNALTLANLNPSGNTSIGAGILLGSQVLDSAVANSRALVVLTDGIQNTLPDIPDATATVSTKLPRQRVFAVGLGLNQLEDKLVQIASVTNGVAQITGDIVGYKEFLLQKLYVQILSDVSDEAFVKDPLGIVLPGQRRATPVYLGEVDVAADFILVFRQTFAYPKYIRVWLEAPDGTIISPSDAGPLPNVEYIQGKSHLFFRWVFPAFPNRPKAHIGRWLVWVENFAGQTSVTGAPTGASEPFYYSVMCKARSDLRLGGYLIQSSYTPGSTMTLVLAPTVYGQPIRLDGPPEVHVTRPDNVTRTLVLNLDANGEYRGEFADTPLVGPYLFSADVSATSPGGNHVTRFRQFTGLIFYQDKTGGGGQPGTGGNGDCKELLVLIRRLTEVIERCCCHEPRSAPAPAALPTAELLDELKRRLEGR